MRLAFALHACLGGFVPLSRVPTRPPLILMSEEPSQLKVQLLSQRAVSGLSPQQQQQQEQAYVSVAAPEAPPPPSFIARARGPFTGLTLLATAAVASWQSNRLYKERQANLLEEFASTMLLYLDDVAGLKATIGSFRSQLGPGPFKGKMFVAFAKALAEERTLSVEVVEAMATVVGLFQLKAAAAAELFAAVADELQDQPSVLGKLVFVTERATPEAAALAGLRSKFPNWSADTVAILQDTMLVQLYKDMCKALPAGSPPPKGADVLKISEAEAARLMQETLDEIAEAEAKELEMQQAKERKDQLEAAMKYAEDLKQADAGDEMEPRPTGTHEYECQYEGCGYTLFPAAGRESKFFGDDFKCPQCGADKSHFVENAD